MAEPRFNVYLMAQAQNDLDSIRTYISQSASAGEACRLLETIEDRLASLETFPLRGNVPKELEDEGNQDYRQLIVSPYRLVYRVLDNNVFVMLIADGRRDIPALLRRRLLSS